MKQILNRIKNESVSIAQAAEEHGISDRTIYSWLKKQVDGYPVMSDVLKLKRENTALEELLGEITLKLSETQKGHNYYRCTKKREMCSQKYVREEILTEQAKSFLQKVSLSSQDTEKVLRELDKDEQKAKLEIIMLFCKISRVK
jgi:transposase-like protein